MPERIIDAHAHVTPRGLIGKRDARLGVTYLPYGELVFDSGEHVPYMPEYLEDTAFPYETMLHLMDQYGITHTVLMANCLTELRENVRAVQEYPQRFSAAMTVAQGPELLRTVKQYREQGLRIIKFEMSDGLGYTSRGWYPNFNLACPEMDEVYAYAGENGITVTVDPNAIGGFAYQVEALQSVTERFPVTHFVICHLGFPDVPMETGSAHERRWREMTDLAKRDNIWFDVAALSDFWHTEDYPYPGALQSVRNFLDAYGPEKLIWGSDAPGTLRNATYRQLITMYDHSPLFSKTEKKLLFSENAIRAYHLEQLFEEKREEEE